MTDMSIRTAARVAGVGLLAMAALAVLGVVGTQSPIVEGDAAKTAANILGNEQLFRAGIVGWLIVAILDVVVALALFIVLRPVNRSLSLLAAWFRVAYAAVFVVSISNLAVALRLLTAAADGTDALGTPQLNAQMMLWLDAFSQSWALGLVVFGVHLGLLGYLVYRSRYMPRVLGILLLIAGVAYVVANLGKVVVPEVAGTLDAIAAAPAALGEIALAVWLLVRAGRLPDVEGVAAEG